MPIKQLSSHSSSFKIMCFLWMKLWSEPKNNRQPLIFLKLDFHKAYSTVNLEFLFEVMDRIGIDPNFTCMIKLFFRAALAAILVNMRKTRESSIMRGVWQGCPFSSYYFLVVGEVLNKMVKVELKASRVKGIKLLGFEAQQLFSQYANFSLGTPYDGRRTGLEVYLDLWNF